MYIRTPRVSVCRVRRWIPSKQGRAFLRLGFLVLVHHSCQAGRVPVSRFRSVFHIRPCSVVAIVNICCVVVSELFVHNISSEVWATASLEVHSHPALQPHMFRRARKLHFPPALYIRLDRLCVV